MQTFSRKFKVETVRIVPGESLYRKRRGPAPSRRGAAHRKFFAGQTRRDA